MICSISCNHTLDVVFGLIVFKLHRTKKSVSDDKYVFTLCVTATIRMKIWLATAYCIDVVLLAL